MTWWQNLKKNHSKGNLSSSGCHWIEGLKIIRPSWKDAQYELHTSQFPVHVFRLKDSWIALENLIWLHVSCSKEINIATRPLSKIFSLLLVWSAHPPKVKKNWVSECQTARIHQFLSTHFAFKLNTPHWIQKGICHGKLRATFPNCCSLF